VWADGKMELNDRDIEILRLVYRFKFCLGRHIRVLAGFSGSRASDRRLRLLIDAGYLGRQKILYGVPFLYTVTHKGRILLGANKREHKIRLEQIAHDVHVLESLIYMKQKFKLALNDIQSERELHIKDGFGARKHHPDFVFNYQGKTFAVEIELTPKGKARLEKNIRDNYLNYDFQIWITGDSKAHALIGHFASEYSNIEIIRLEDVLEICKDMKSQE